VASGAFSAINALTSRVKNGVNLVVTKTVRREGGREGGDVNGGLTFIAFFLPQANKGMVGMAFRYHDR